jgi:hypothetical protein
VVEISDETNRKYTFPGASCSRICTESCHDRIVAGILAVVPVLQSWHAMAILRPEWAWFLSLLNMISLSLAISMAARSLPAKLRSLKFEETTKSGRVSCCPVSDSISLAARIEAGLNADYSSATSATHIPPR